jgi:hypothetical protein
MSTEITKKTVASSAVIVDGSIRPVGQTPQRIQLSRRKGWRLPPNTVVVSRPSKWGNPFKATDYYSVAQAVEDYWGWLLFDTDGQKVLEAARRELRGKNLACWCEAGSPCHADALLELVSP